MKKLLYILFLVVLAFELASAIYYFCVKDWKECIHSANMFIWVGLCFWGVIECDNLHKENETLLETTMFLSKKNIRLQIENQDLMRRLKDPVYNKIWNDIEAGDKAFIDYYNNVIAKRDSDSSIKENVL